MLSFPCNHSLKSSLRVAFLCVVKLIPSLFTQLEIYNIKREYKGVVFMYLSISREVEKGIHGEAFFKYFRRDLTRDGTHHELSLFFRYKIKDDFLTLSFTSFTCLFYFIFIVIIIFFEFLPNCLSI